MNKREGRDFRNAVLNAVVGGSVLGMVTKKRADDPEPWIKRATRQAIDMLFACCDGYCNSRNNRYVTRGMAKAQLYHLIEIGLVERVVIEWDDDKTIVVKYRNT